MKILATADWHLGAMPGPVVNGKNARAEDTLRCVDELIKRAREIRPDLIIHSGDVFNVSKTWSERGMNEVQDAIVRLEALAEVAPVAVIQGTRNHDGTQHFEMLAKYFDGRSDVHIITKPGVHDVMTYDGAVNLCALPGFDRGYWRAQNPGVDREQETAAFNDALEKMIVGMRAMCRDGLPSILVAHYTVECANTESGQLMLFSQFEPIISQRTLAAANYDLCCFGHIHRPQALGNNAFYSGAVNALNFNDQNQERGFYVHTLEGKALVDSAFVKLNSPRRFVTIRMDDNDIADFNAAGILHAHALDVAGAIVRVLYSCTDEHHKALNRALMEKALTDAGAFWVQEITPVDISVTVDRTELSGESDPKHNLREYLGAKLEAGTVSESVAKLATEKGDAIIDRVMAEGRAGQSGGLFVPVEISVTNYRNYRSETFSFEDVRFATINGRNGVGKSSLFMDAVYDALYEEPREGDLTGWISNDPSARSGAIVFTFRVGDKLWRVSRTRVKSGKATLNLSEQVDGEWVDRSCEKLRDTQSAIEAVIGMNGQTLRACALIMQDQYGLFLQAGKEERMQILSDILGLGIYDAMSGEAASAATEANREVRVLQARASELDQQRGDVDGMKQRRATTARQIAAYDEQIWTLNRETEELNERLAKLNTTAEVYGLYRRQLEELRQSIAQLEDQKAAAERDRDGFAAMLAGQSEIRDGAERYRIAAAQRDALQDRVATFAVLKEKKASVESAIRAAEDGRAQNMARRSELASRADALNRAIGKREEYEGQQREHDALEAEIAAAERNNAAWREADAQVNREKAALSELRGTARAEYRERALEIEALKKRVNLLEDSNCPVAESATCRFLADAIAAKDALPELERKHTEATDAAKAALDAQEAAVRAAEAARDGLARVDEVELSRMRGRVTALAVAAVMLKQIEGYAAELRLVEQSRAEAEARDDALVYEIESGKSEAAKLDQELKEYAEAYDCYLAVLEDIKKYRPFADQEQQLIGAQDRMAAAQERVEDLSRRIDSSREQMADREELLKNDADTEADRVQTRAKIEEVKRLADAVKAERDALMGVRARLDADIERADAISRQIDALNAETEGRAREASAHELLKAAFGPNGVPHNIMRSIIPIFEATASNILGQMTGGRMAVELVTERALRSNAKKEITTLDVIINDADTGRLPYLSRSGGERVKASLSVILALAEILKSKLGIRIGFLCLDECPFLDQDGVQSFCDALETIQRRYPDMKVMAITHDDSFKARFPQAITVYKDETGSHAVMD